MNLHRFLPLVAGALLLAACEKGPTEPSLSAQLDQVDPYVLTFSATNGLPAGPFHIPGPGSRFDARGPGAPFPDSLKLTDAQQAAIKALRDAFESAHAADLAKLQAIHDQARDAIKTGKTRAEVRAILETAKPILESLKGAFDALRDAIANVLTPAQKAWIASHRPDGPPPRP
jgi:Spy/CpxP family protein refolding chaperone